MTTEILDDGINVTVDSKIYSVDVIYKCFYWYTDRFSIDVETTENNRILICMRSKDVSADHSGIEEKVKQDLIDFRLRDIVTKETQVIRELLIAKAFAHEGEDAPRSVISDPVGFDPLSVLEG